MSFNGLSPIRAKETNSDTNEFTLFDAPLSEEIAIELGDGSILYISDPGQPVVATT